MKKRLLSFVFLFSLLASFASAETIEVGTYVMSVEEYDTSTGKYALTFFLGMQCDYNCSLDDLLFINGIATNVVQTKDDPQTKEYRIRAELQDSVDLRKYPFDAQNLTIIIESTSKEADELAIANWDSYSGVDDRVTFPGWALTNIESHAANYVYEDHQETYGRYALTLTFARERFGSVLQHFVPIFILIIILLFTFIVGLDKMDLRIGIASSILLAAFVFHMTLSSRIPPTGYPTFADKFMILTYLVALLSFFIDTSILRFVQDREKRFAKKVDTFTRYAMIIGIPLAYVLLFLFFS